MSQILVYEGTRETLVGVHTSFLILKGFYFFLNNANKMLLGLSCVFKN
jgi:hypothetical protein